MSLKFEKSSEVSFLNVRFTVVIYCGKKRCVLCEFFVGQDKKGIFFAFDTFQQWRETCSRSYLFGEKGGSVGDQTKTEHHRVCRVVLHLLLIQSGQKILRLFLRKYYPPSV